MEFWAVYVVYNPDIRLLEKSLASIKQQIDGIIVVDNGNGPDEEFLKGFGAILVRENGNAGIAAALNDGFREAVRRGAGCIISFDQDSVPPSDMVGKYRDFLESHPDAGEVGCRYSGEEAFGRDCETDHVITSGAAIPAAVFNAVGDFREDYFIDMVDVEYSWRIRKNGWKVYQLSDVVLEHNLGEGLGGIRIFGKKRLCYVKHNPLRWYYMVRNTLLLRREYKDIFDAESKACRKRVFRSLFRSLVFNRERCRIFRSFLKAVKDYRSYSAYQNGGRPLVSVIVPNFNHAAFLRNRLDSILKQTYGNLEIIVLDDCSSDDSRKIIEEYRGRVSKVVFNDKNSGSAFLQWKKGIEMASGEYIWIAESDDMAADTLVEKLMTPMAGNPDCAYSFCRCSLIDTDGQDCGVHLHQKNLPSRSRIWNGRRFIRTYLSRSNMVVNASGVIFKKTFAGQIDGSYENYRSCGDWVFWILLAEKGDVAFCPEKLNGYRQHSGNVTSKLRDEGVGAAESAAVKSLIQEKGYGMGAAEEWLRRKFRK